MGILTKEGAPSWHPAPREIQKAGCKLADLCHSYDWDITRVALRFCLDHPDVSSTQVGISRPEHLKKNLEPLQLENDPNVLKELKAIIAPMHNRIWPSGRPETMTDKCDAQYYLVRCDQAADQRTRVPCPERLLKRVAGRWPNKPRRQRLR
jgi:predicted aldo/keto reductase-like oxidoreductase